MPTPNDATPEDLDEGPYAGKTIAEIVHDYAVIRGDLSDPDARAQLVHLIEHRIATARRGAPDATDQEGREDTQQASLPDLPSGYRFRIGDCGWGMEVVLEFHRPWRPWDRIGSEPIQVDERVIDVRIAEAAQKVWRPEQTRLTERAAMRDYLAGRGPSTRPRADSDVERRNS